MKQPPFPLPLDAEGDPFLHLAPLPLDDEGDAIPDALLIDPNLLTSQEVTEDST